MHRLRPLSTVTAFVLAFAAGSTLAAPPAPAPLPAWDQLSPAQRDLVIAPLRDRWNADPKVRTRLFQHAQRWQQLTPEQRARMRHGLGKWEHMDPQQRETMRALFHRMRDLTPAQRTALREQWRAMTPQQRQEWVEANRAPAD
jgi:predicted Fe-S protein YdhL (DUF1289 family)